MIYLDNAATTRPYPGLLEDIREFFGDNFGNPSSAHPAGIRAAEAVSESRDALARIFRVPSEGVVFCGSGTESDNLAILGVLDAAGRKCNAITSPLEHPAVSSALESIAGDRVEVRSAEVDSATGKIKPESLEALTDERTLLVAIQHVNSETGAIQDIAGLNSIVKSKAPGAIFHSDGVQAFGKIPVDLRALGVDLYSVSAHKIHGAKGAGALISTGKIPLKPLIQGGGQEFGVRSGTENPAALVSFAKAAGLAIKNLESNRRAISEFSAWFKSELKKSVPDVRIFEVENQVPHIVNLSVPGVPGEVLLNHLAEKGVYVSTGSACNARSGKLSPALRALGFNYRRIKETVRISFAASEIPKDRDALLSRFIEAVETLKEVV